MLWLELLRQVDEGVDTLAESSGPNYRDFSVLSTRQLYVLAGALGERGSGLFLGLSVRVASALTKSNQSFRLSRTALVVHEEFSQLSRRVFLA